MGFCMITLGVANVGGAVIVALVSQKVPREVVLGFGGVMHMALMIGFLIWIPDQKPMIFFILAAAWGVCDAVWQTQCNSKYKLLKIYSIQRIRLFPGKTMCTQRKNCSFALSQLGTNEKRLPVTDHLYVF